MVCIFPPLPSILLLEIQSIRKPPTSHHAARPINQEEETLSGNLALNPQGPQIDPICCWEGGGSAPNLHGTWIDFAAKRASTGLFLHETATACVPAFVTTHMIERAVALADSKTRLPPKSRGKRAVEGSSAEAVKTLN